MNTQIVSSVFMVCLTVIGIVGFLQQELLILILSVGLILLIWLVELGKSKDAKR